MNLESDGDHVGMVQESFWIVSEAMFNLGVVMGILPPKGLVLPFISYGASAMMSNLLAIGLLLSISAECNDIPVEKGWISNKQRVKLQANNRLLDEAPKCIRRQTPSVWMRYQVEFGVNNRAFVAQEFAAQHLVLGRGDLSTRAVFWQGENRVGPRRCTRQN